MKCVKLYFCDCGFASTDRQIVEEHEIDCMGAKPKIKKDVPEWKQDYDIYLQLVKEAKEKLKRDKNNYEKFVKYNNGFDYILSLEKCCEFWESNDGWEYCKKKRKGNIDMEAALKRGIEMKNNRVWAKNSTVLFQFEEENTPKEGDINKDGDKVFIAGKWVQL